MFVAIKADTVEMATNGAEMKPSAYPQSESKNPPNRAAAVPSTETAPSVPGSTRLRFVIRNVVFPNALPISEAKVSESFVAKEVM